MNLHIEHDQFPRGIVIWVDQKDGFGPYLPAHDPYGLSKIDQEAENRLRRLLQIAEEGEWQTHGMDASEFASKISACLRRINQTGPEGFETPVFVCPNLLGRALSILKSVIVIDEWLLMFPDKAEA